MHFQKVWHLKIFDFLSVWLEGNFWERARWRVGRLEPLHASGLFPCIPRVFRWIETIDFRRRRPPDESVAEIWVPPGSFWALCD
jgi:hypothetical protein